ncbi:MAG: YidC/Oxa1 family membrane protein insertase [Candidatus Peregrinibacteria bacterium]|nr:YidC/Oxa1 family membrane protein insertase [Candidatus Peregrinibacteria bacterium]
MAAPAKRSNLLQFALIFGIVYLSSQVLLRTFFPEQFGGEQSTAGIVLAPADATVKGGHHPVLTVTNTTAKDLSLQPRCPQPPVEVYGVQTGSGSGDTLTELTATGTVLPCVDVENVPAGETVTLDLAPWKYSLFGEYGLYEARLPVEPATIVAPSSSGATIQNVLTTRFSIHEPGFITQVFRAFITKPFLNFLLLIASYVPGHNLGIAIIILTVCVKLLLFYPTQKSLQGQKELQKIQPLLEELKRKHSDDAQRLHAETLKLWKEHNVNPLQSCLPTLIQFPVLIGLFYVIRDGSVLALSRHLIYEPYQHLTWTFGTWFLGFDLLAPDPYILPITLAVLQFLQLKLAFTLSKRKKAASQSVIDVPAKDEKLPFSPEKMQQTIMLYGLPLMVGFFAIKFPAAVALYWGISTLFGIGQQLVVNRKA